MKDSLRLIIWIIVASFTLGGLWAQRKSDMDMLLKAGAAATDRIDKAEIAQRDLAGKVEAAQVGTTAILTSLEGLHTEIRYVNEKIDTLRQDVRDSRAGAAKGRE